MSDRVFIDTNVLTYLFDTSEPQKRVRANQVLSAETETGELIVSTQVLQELYVSLTRGKDPIATPELARQAVEAAAGYTVVQVDLGLVRAGIRVSQTALLSFWDGLIIAAAASAGCTRLLTEDLNAGQIIEGVRIENPFG
jgi:predicted nucleic acid-binding protein